MTETLQAGPDLDARVAEAIGYELTKKAVRRVEAVYVLQDDGVAWKRFSPSMEINVAVESAKKLGCLTLQTGGDGSYAKIETYPMGMGHCVEGYEDDECLAICAAILKVKE
jgi:hypothetical protein